VFELARDALKVVEDSDVPTLVRSLLDMITPDIAEDVIDEIRKEAFSVSESK
jgi:hypothetical protein